MIGAPTQDAGAPGSLFSPEAEFARSCAAAFYARSPKERAQDRCEFDAAVYAADDVRAALSELFRSKCAYCESPLQARTLAVDHFRPAAGALDLAGSISPDHYWWLAYEWENLLPCCPECASFKGLRFPVRSERASPGAIGDALLAEEPLLLDPRRDRPEQHLVFAEDGSVASVTPEGQATIEVLGLNRAQLLSARSAALADVREEWAAIADAPTPDAVERLFAVDAPYAALRRQFLNAWAHARLEEVDAALSSVPEGPDSVEEVAGDVPVVTAGERRKVKSAFDARQVAQDDYSLAEGANVSEDYFGRTRRIERIVVRNFKVIGELDLELPQLASETVSAPWLMLLGENGVGKSSLLQALALTLMGQEQRDALALDARLFVRNGTRSGSAEVYLSGSPEPIRLRFSRRSPRFHGDPEPKLLLLGYGPTRLLPRRGESTPVPSTVARVENLFDPFFPIGDATGWLLAFDRDRFDAIGRALKSILDLEEGDRLIQNRRAGRIDVEAFGARVPLAHLSDGYQSVVALTTDVMAVLLQRWPTVEAAEGTLLIDELGAHLHPSWKMKIVAALRAVFPRVQVVGSTHDPLCLRGLGDGEVVVMRRDPEGEIVAVTDLPSVAGLRVDQLLTSEHFGLNSTIDPELDALFAEYYQLKAKPKLDAAEQRRHDDLKARLEELQVLGQTRRERIILEAADEFLAREGKLADPGERVKLRKQTRTKIADIWSRVGEGERP